MRIIVGLVIAALAFASNANADTFTVPVNSAWSSETTLSIDFDLPANPTGEVSVVNSITIGISHTFASDLTVSVTSPGGGVFDLVAGQNGGADLGVVGDGTAGDEADYTFVAPGTTGIAGWGPLGGGTTDANAWVDGPLGKDGWNVTIIDDFAGDGGSVTSVTIDFDKAAIPEPASGLAVLGLGSIVAMRRRR